MSDEGLYGRDGAPITYAEWRASFYGPIEDRMIARATVGDAVVSTVYTGFDPLGPLLGLGGRGPRIFETMVFGGDLEGWSLRYTTEQDARDGHDAIVAWLGLEAATRPALPITDEQIERWLKGEPDSDAR